jgi:hypothetical protein
MIDFSRDYYQELFLNLEKIKDDIMSEEFDTFKLNILWNTTDQKGDIQYQFKKVPKKYPKNCFKPFTNKSVESFMEREEILAFTKIILPAGQHVTPHYDNSYWGPDFFRAHIPLMDTEAYFTYGDEKIVWEKGKLYFFDVRNFKHAADNYSDKDFEFIAIDIKIENEK